MARQYRSRAEKMFKIKDRAARLERKGYEIVWARGEVRAYDIHEWYVFLGFYW